MGHTQTECHAVLSRLFGYLDGEIAGDDRAAIDRHLAECVACARRFGFEGELKALIRRKCEGRLPPAELTEAIRIRLRESSP
jgi:mycothiol system anti-sigma-R factor